MRAEGESCEPILTTLLAAVEAHAMGTNSIQKAAERGYMIKD